MNLKESYQYQNFLKQLFTSAYVSLREMNVVKTMRAHYRSRAAEGAVDETVDETPSRPFGDIPVDAVIGFVDAIICERERLASAITSAKFVAKTDSLDLDAALSANKQRYQLIQKLESLAEIKPEMIKKSTGLDYKFNVEGNQTAYHYPIEETITIDFDHQQVRAYLKELKAKAAARSMQAEKAMLETIVDFEPQFDMNDSYMDTLTAFAIARKFMTDPSVCE